MTASSRRRSNRRKNEQGSARSDSPITDEQAEDTSETRGANSKDSCPACSDNVKGGEGASRRDTWIRCDSCKHWFHWNCVALADQDHEAVDRWYCKTCLEADSNKAITFKPPVRKSSRKRPQRDYASLHAGLEADPDKWVKLMENKPIKDNKFPRLLGHQLTLDWLDSDDGTFREPIIIPSPEGLGMRMPTSGFQVSDVTRILGGNTPVEVIDVHTQSSVRDWTLEKWNAYYYTDAKYRDRIRNVISLEVSDSELSSQICPPRIVKELDWVGNFWPSAKRGRGQIYPKVQLYCLMSVAHAWTDWHVDFAGSSVYYHILQGAKTFYFIRPTQANLFAYEKWSGSETQNHVWLGDLVDEVIRVDLQQGNTMIIPTGWIHAVHTPQDSLVFGGNFLHSYDVATQLRVREIEIATQVPKKFRFPMFVRLCWYVAEKMLLELRGKDELPPRVLESIRSLANFLVSEVRNIERGGIGSRESKEAVPVDKVKDAPALARELRWRIRVALGAESGDELRMKPKIQPVVNGGPKRKRPPTDCDDTSELQRFRHYKPRKWDAEYRLPNDRSVAEQRMAHDTPDSRWLAWEESETPELSGGELVATVTSSTSGVVRMRRFTLEGAIYLERHRATHVQETWKWGPGQDLPQ